MALDFAGQRSRGDVIVTRTGLEGGAVYNLAAPLRAAIEGDGFAVLHLALRPDLSIETLRSRLDQRPPKQSVSTWLRKRLNLPPVAISLLRETAGAALPSMTGEQLATVLNAVPLRLTSPAPIAGAISTAGGVSRSQVDRDLMLIRRPGVFVAGEMLDWEAPTGGYLLQACLALGAVAGRTASIWARAHDPAHPAR